MPDVLSLYWRQGCGPGEPVEGIYAVVNYGDTGDPVPTCDDIFLFAVGRGDYEIAERIIGDHNRSVAEG